MKNKHFIAEGIFFQQVDIIFLFVFKNNMSINQHFGMALDGII